MSRGKFGELKNKLKIAEKPARISTKKTSSQEIPKKKVEKELKRQERIEQKKRDHLELLSTMSIEERLAKIEEWIYDHELNHPSKELRFL